MKQNKKKKHFKKRTTKDLKREDVLLLAKAYSLNPNEFLCFGNSFFILNELKFVSDENQITPEGIEFLRYAS